MTAIAVNYFASKIIEIVAGENKTTFQAHAALLCKSDKLKAGIEGDWADKDRIVLPDWDEETVSRLLEWLYCGTYTYPLPRKQTNPSNEEVTKSYALEHYVETPAAGLVDQIPLFRSSVRSQPTSHTPTGLPTVADPYNACENFKDYLPKMNLVLDWEKRVINGGLRVDHEANYHQTIMAHAKLYALSKYMLFPDLAHLAYNNICTVLIFNGKLQAGSSLVEDIVMLIRYAYANTETLTNSLEPLRDLLTSYVAISFGAWQGPTANQLMEEGGDFVVDITTKVGKRMVMLTENRDPRNNRARPTGLFADMPAIHGTGNVNQRGFGTTFEAYMPGDTSQRDTGHF